MDCDSQSLYFSDGDIDDADLLAAAEASELDLQAAVEAAELDLQVTDYLVDCTEEASHDFMDLISSSAPQDPETVDLISPNLTINLISSPPSRHTEHQYHGWRSENEAWEHDPPLPHKPFLRPPYPSPVLANPRIPALTPQHALRTAFRIYEAIALFYRHGTGVLVELFARVGEEPVIEVGEYVLRDLYHDRKPWITAAWVGRVEGGLVRVVGRMAGRDRVEVLSISATDWKEVGVVRNVVGG